MKLVANVDVGLTTSSWSGTP